MNRLWVRISLVICCVVLIVAIFPFAFREISRRAGLENNPFTVNPPKPPDPQLREYFERQAWIGVSRTIIVGAIAGLIAGILLTRWMIAPLKKLEEGADAIAKGELGHQVPVRGSIEMQSVADSFNLMASELAKQEEIRRKLLADVSHELRHPVHVLNGNLQAINEGVYPLTMDEIGHLIEQTGQLKSLVNDLHELALADSEDLPLHKSIVDLVKIVSSVTQQYKPVAKQNRIYLTDELPSDPVRIIGDSQRLHQAFQNLLANAIQFTPDGGEVKVTFYENTESVDIKVQDTGYGISAEDLQKVFNRFYRGDASRNRENGGTGLGLAIARAIIQAHGGNIQVFSEGENKGSVFTIHFPKVSTQM